MSAIVVNTREVPVPVKYRPVLFLRSHVSGTAKNYENMIGPGGVRGATVDRRDCSWRVAVV